jgi:hypothetical protein
VLCDNLSAASLKAIGGKDKCTTLAKGQKGEDEKVTSVTVDGDTATVKGTGGTDTIKLVKEDGDWKVDAGA